MSLQQQAYHFHGSLLFTGLVGLDEVLKDCQVGITARDKLQKVVGWMQRARLVHCGSVLNYYEVSS